MTPNELRLWVIAQLAAQTNLQVWDGEPGDGNTALGYQAGARDVTLDGDGRAHMYAALYVGSGRRDISEDRETGHDGPLVATFQVTAAGGDPNRCLLAAQKVMAALEAKRAAAHLGRVELQMDAGPPRIDRDPSPSRHFLPLIFAAPLA